MMTCSLSFADSFIFGCEASWPYGSSAEGKMADGIQGRLRGYISAFYAGPPCETYSAARHVVCSDTKVRPVRSSSHPWGFPTLPIEELVQGKTGNMLMWIVLMAFRGLAVFSLCWNMHLHRGMQIRWAFGGPSYGRLSSASAPLKLLYFKDLLEFLHRSQPLWCLLAHIQIWFLCFVAIRYAQIFPLRSQLERIADNFELNWKPFLAHFAVLWQYWEIGLDDFRPLRFWILPWAIWNSLADLSSSVMLLWASTSRLPPNL